VDGAVAARERRDKAGHATFSSGEDHHHEEHAHHSDGHGYDAASQHRHRSIVSSITDCHMVVSRGMGMGAFDHLTSAKIVPIITSNQSIDSAIREIIDGTIVHHGERLH
jgi:predicted Fe-Mo cluster-binding NifX family protein